MTLLSTRNDGRGHWPAGKRRSSLTASERRSLVAAVRRAVKSDSARGVARTLRYSDRTIRRWLAGEDWPDPGSPERLLKRLR